MTLALSQVDEYEDFKKNYCDEMNRAFDNPGTTVVCHQRYTFGEYIAVRILGVEIVPRHKRLEVTYYDNGMGFLIASAKPDA